MDEKRLKEMCEFIEKYFEHRYFWSWLDDILRYCCNIEDLGLHIYKLVDQDDKFLVIERFNNANIMINYKRPIKEVLSGFIENTFEDSDDSIIAFNKAYDKYISKKEKYEPILEKIDDKKITNYEINCSIEVIDKASKRAA